MGRGLIHKDHELNTKSFLPTNQLLTACHGHPSCMALLINNQAPLRLCNDSNVIFTFLMFHREGEGCVIERGRGCDREGEGV